MQCVTLPRITELNPHLLCVLCGGYYIDATSIIECLHAFCKSCIVRYLETHKYCPICDVLVHKTEPLQNIRPDIIRQSIVYKLVPNLYAKEMRNRRNFYIQVNPQQLPNSAESRGEITENSNFFSMDDLICLSLEYIDSVDEKKIFFVAPGSKRYFRCRAAVTVKTLRKLLAVKYVVGVENEIHLFLNGNQLPDHFKLLDIAYISSWKRVGYIRILYEILNAHQEDSSNGENSLPSEVSPAMIECKNNNYVGAILAECMSFNSNIEKKNLDSVTQEKTVNPENVESSSRTERIKIDVNSTSSIVSNINNASQPQASKMEVHLDTKRILTQSTQCNRDQVSSKEIITSDLNSCDVVSATDKTNDKIFDENENTKSVSSGESNFEDKNGKSSPTKLSESSSLSAEKHPAGANSSLKIINVKTKCANRMVGDSKTNSTSVSSIASKNSELKILNYEKVTTGDSAIMKAKQKCRNRNRSELLPPVPALRMITEAPRPSNSKVSSIGIQSLIEPKILIPRITKAHTLLRFPCHSPTRINNQLAPTPTATDLISLYSKLPTRNSALKKSHGNVPILRIDPKTLSPIESSSSNTNVVPVSSGSTGASRKMLPCKPTTSSSYTTNAFSRPSAPIHISSSAFSKHSSTPLYSPYPGLEYSSLHPMNELVRRMFPNFGFPPTNPTKTPLDPTICRLPTYPQSIQTAVSHFLSTPGLAKQTKFEKTRRKQSPLIAARAPSLNGGEKTAFNIDITDSERNSKRANMALTNGQLTSPVKRKNSELSDFSINNIIPIGDSKRPLMHACTADGINQVCDQAQPISASLANESRKSS